MSIDLSSLSQLVTLMNALESAKTPAAPVAAGESKADYVAPGVKIIKRAGTFVDRNGKDRTILWIEAGGSYAGSNPYVAHMLTRDVPKDDQFPRPHFREFPMISRDVLLQWVTKVVPELNKIGFFGK